MTRRVLVCYGSRYGSTAEVAQEMENVIKEHGGYVDLVDLRRGKKTQDLQSYDLVVIGSGIQAGRWTKEPLELIKKNLESLSKTRVALFVLSGYATDPKNYEMVQREYLDKVVEEILSEYTEKGVGFAEIDVDENSNLANELRITNVPSIFFFKDGKMCLFTDENGDQHDRIVGALNKTQLTNLLDMLLENNG
ncbi:MAG: flavodoxin domain-containing protein [Candidatus Thorarchaeota archaeon]